MSGFPPVFAGARFAVMGLGRNGAPVARALASMGAEVLAWDDDAATRAALDPSPYPLPQGEGEQQLPLPQGEGEQQLPLPQGEGDWTRIPPPLAGGGRGEGWAQRIIVRPPTAADRLDALVLSPGIPHRLPRAHPIASLALSRGWPVLSDAELLFRAVRAAGSAARFVGITGTNGKSTTTALLAHILRAAGIEAAAGGNLGPAALALPLLGDHGAYVLEMSSYMLERIVTLRFDAAAMLNLGPDHLDRHGDMETYVAVKRAVFDRQTVRDLAVIGLDDPDSRRMAAWLRTRPARVEMVSGIGVANAAPALPGEHNAQNAAAARALALGLGATEADIARGIASFPGLPHRQRLVGQVDGVAFIDDSKATNADAAARALGCYERIVWIAGGQAKFGGIEALAPYFPRIAHALLIGRDAAELAATLTAHGVRHEIAGMLDAAVPAALAAARGTGAVVLLSPACASFDQFSGFEARGLHFASLVAGLARGKAA